MTDSAGNRGRSHALGRRLAACSLTGYRAPDAESGLPAKALQVLTKDSRERIISRRVLRRKARARAEAAVKRHERAARLPSARVLAGSVETDGSGRATCTVTLPESLTTYGSWPW